VGSAGRILSALDRAAGQPLDMVSADEGTAVSSKVDPCTSGHPGHLLDVLRIRDGESVDPIGSARELVVHDADESWVPGWKDSNG